MFYQAMIRVAQKVVRFDKKITAGVYPREAGARMTISKNKLKKTGKNYF